ncbi:hypothetical protein Hbl1158_02500 [Halobaculum sp. CBA1158]|uniref:hypothetical protein n=1 Tax=Halobaculum sp. CBA1158 TaxID=2904243 RepID=UPI001F27FB56|nr:hypothetical protein [Halobaculum sp. CBA1158]UIP00259.1 hypothetical protein Hbl1158_02500 [Halobaculum sp. CBA1158]
MRVGGVAVAVASTPSVAGRRSPATTGLLLARPRRSGMTDKDLLGIVLGGIALFMFLTGMLLVFQ